CGKEVLAQINEIKGRDTTIGKLTTRVAQLEGLLESAMRDSEAGKIAPESRSKEKKDDSQALEVATPMSDPPAPDADQVTTDSTPPSPPLAARHILNLPGPSGAVRQYGSSRPAAVVARHKFAEINKASYSSEDVLQPASSDDLVVEKVQEPGVRKFKRSHDDMGYGEDIDDEDEDDTPFKNVTSRNKVTKTTRRASVQNKQVGTSAATTANNGTSKSRGKKRR
ncbi:hypothetical protein FRB90_007329, partial [Tulasnella sp. 427]